MRFRKKLKNSVLYNSPLKNKKKKVIKIHIFHIEIIKKSHLLKQNYLIYLNPKFSLSAV